ncbi:MAG: addiction module antidote protein [Pseudomonadota bacterium]
MAKYKISELEEFDASRYLGDDEACGVYLTEMLKENDMGLFLSALGEVAKARGMTEIAKRAGMNRESLYKSFGKGKKPEFETVLKVSRALGLELQLTPAGETPEAA